MTTYLLWEKPRKTAFQMHIDRSSGLHFLWAAPRSVSTAFGRCMAAHPDVTLVHEPFTETYHFGPERKSMRYGELPPSIPESSFTAKAVNDRLRDEAASKVVFVKELAFQGEPFVEDDLILRSTHFLIVRRPAVVAASLKKLKPDFSEDEFGFQAIHRIWKRCLGSSKNVMIVDGDHFRAHPHVVIDAVCARLGLVFQTSMMAWKTGTIKRWESHEQASQARWHRTLEGSRTILPPVPLQSDPLSNLTFAQQKIVHDADRLYHEILGGQ